VHVCTYVARLWTVIWIDGMHRLILRLTAGQKRVHSCVSLVDPYVTGFL
jgi:hypothetical protein